MKRAVFIRFDQGAMHVELAVWVVGQEGDQYKIQTDNRIKLPGRTQHFEPGQTLYVPKSSVWDAGQPLEYLIGERRC